MEKESLQEKLARQRTILALERTFAAWMRTGLAGLAGGLVVIKLIPFKSSVNQVVAYIAGILLIFWGIFILLSSHSRYKKDLSELKTDEVPNSAKMKFEIVLFGLVIISVLILLVSLADIFQ